MPYDEALAEKVRRAFALAWTAKAEKATKPAKKRAKATAASKAPRRG